MQQNENKLQAEELGLVDYDETEVLDNGEQDDAEIAVGNAPVYRLKIVQQQQVPLQ